MKTLILHPSKTWGFLFPIFAKEAVGMYYESFAAQIQKYFRLTPEQWEAVLSEYEHLHQTIAPDVCDTTAPGGQSIMDCPNSELADICITFARKWDDYEQLAKDREKQNFAHELNAVIGHLETTASRVNLGCVLSMEERNELRSAIKHTEERIVAELIFPEEAI